MGGTRLWQALAGISTLGWILTLVYLRTKRPRTATEAPLRPYNVDAGRALKLLLTACAANDARAARSAAIRWAATLDSARGIVSIDQVAGMFDDDELNRELESLNASLYRSGISTWEGERLAQCARRLHTARRQPPGPGAQQLGLYPQ